MHVAIIDYGSGNLHSAAKAFERAAREAGTGQSIKVTADPSEVLSAERIVLPGVGAFADCKQGLAQIPGMIDALEQSVRRDGKPFLGICVGLQLMAERGLEHGDTPGLGWIGGEVRQIEPKDASLKIPHMGWNTLRVAKPHMHYSTEFRPAKMGFTLISCTPIISCRPTAETLIATTDYAGPVTAFVAKDNMAGSQFHPEKSQKLGLALIANFLRWKP